MANPTIYPSAQQWLGIAKETTYGTPVATPTLWLPIINPKHEPHQAMLRDEGLRGNMAMAQGYVAGPRYDTFDFETYPYIDSIFALAMNIYGGPDTVTGTAAPYTHKTSLLNTGNGQPTSWTLNYFNGAETWQLAGAQQAQLDLETKVADSLAKVTSSWMSLPGVKVANPTNTPDTNAPMPSWSTTVTVGGTAATVYSDVKVQWKRNTEAVFTATGTQSPYVIFVGELEVTGDLTAVYDGYATAGNDLAAYLANTQPALVLKTTPAGDAAHYLQWTSSVTAYTGVTVTGSSKWVEAQAKIEAVANATDVVGTNGGTSPGQFQVINTTASY